MSLYAAEPVPTSVDGEVAEYLMRQLVAIQNALNNSSIVMEVSQIPARPVVGAIVNLNDRDDPAKNGFYACVYNSQGEGEWRKVTTS